jgi:hypothetical protein
VTDASIEEVLRRHEQELLELPNVVAVGIGERGGKPAIAVFVTRKAPESELAPGERIPHTLDGQPVDVAEIGVVETEER